MTKKISLIIIIMLLYRPVFANSGTDDISPVVKRVIVEIPAGELARREKLKDMASKMIRLKPGEPVLETDILTSIELLKQSKQFSRIEVPDQDWDAASTDIVFRLTPSTLISDIKVKGSFPVFKDEVIDATDYTVGAAFNENSQKENIEFIEALFVENGYIDPVVNIRTEKTGELELSVIIEVEKDEFIKIDRIEFTGNDNFADTRLKMQMKSYQLPIRFWSKGKRAIESDLENDMKKLLAFYRKKGFAEAVIEHDLKKDGQEDVIVIILNIDEGPKYKIAFSGNHEFSGYTLKKNLILKTKGNLDDFELKKSLKNIKKRYIEAGYENCKVDFTAKTLEESGRKIKEINIIIEENTRYLVRSSTVKGSDSMDEKELEKEILTQEKAFLYDGPYVDDKFQDDSKAVENYYGSQGFIDTKVTGDVTWDKKDEENIVYGNVVFSVTEGYQKIITAVDIQGLTDPLEQEIRQIIETRPDSPLIEAVVQKDRMAILSYLAEKGYIYAEVEARIKPGEDKESCAIEFQIDKKIEASVGGVWTFGNLRTKDSVMLRHNTITDDEPVSLSKFVSLQKEIRNINSIERSDFNALGIKENLDQVFFIADIEERKPYYLEASLGYDTARDAFFSILAGDRNFMGMNRELYTSAEVSGVGYEAVVGIKASDFMSQYIRTRFSIYASQEELKNQTFGSRKLGSELLFKKDFFKHLKLGTSFSLEFREEYPLDGILDPDPIEYPVRLVVTATPFLTWSSVDSFVKPTKGIFFNASAGYNKDIREDIDDFIKYRVKAKYYYQPFPKLVMAFQGMYGYIQNFNDTSKVPDDQLFFLGGISDVRGFEENELVTDAFGDAVGGQTGIVGSIEARIDLGMNLEVPFFLDAGSVKNTYVEGSNEDFKFTVGTGIRYMTPIGPVGILYGYKLNPEENEDTGMFYFSIGYTF